ncbi:beta-carotene 15,15'-monooxygenase [Salinadaptatus halalkaliphilus]|uniref:Probable beta-carotene 15,15'-dioxygenase n=1 Tax=Salinadaptatus halalkaliphilus TaxID=2419781 RepID=A0A4S3TMC8_9EURY|nr:Brp/Blh family beta-carotene 15,15'-dioxygenase [Salinadaptatus halalkaliphilus]THE64175.1 beta-carotene 15,15'-monooxygenase [Salinadaptatus halalkaliphilus]
MVRSDSHSAGAGDDTEPTESARRRAARASYGFGALAVLAGLALSTLVDSVPLAYQYLPLAVSVLAFGLPHGAVDHLVVPRAANRRPTARSFAVVGGLYLVVGGAYAVVWFLAPVVAFVLFILVTLLHWGQGDVYAVRVLTGGCYLEGLAPASLTVLVRGGIPMLVPLVAFPGQYAVVAESLVGLFDPGAAAALEPIFQPTVRLGVAVGVGALVVGSLSLSYRRAETLEPWLADVVETLGLVGFFAVVPPILAIGFYFPLWHSVRHILRTMLVDDVASEALAAGNDRLASWRFVRDAAPLTAGALAVLGGLAVLVPYAPTNVPDVLALYLVCLAVLTLPHVVVVTLLDRTQGLLVWSTTSG